MEPSGGCHRRRGTQADADDADRADVGPSFFGGCLLVQAWGADVLRIRPIAWTVRHNRPRPYDQAVYAGGVSPCQVFTPYPEDTPATATIDISLEHGLPSATINNGDVACAGVLATIQCAWYPIRYPIRSSLPRDPARDHQSALPAGAQAPTPLTVTEPSAEVKLPQHAAMLC
jgi:hypothetical protein